MERKQKRQQRTVGGILKIFLEEGYHTYARILEYKIAFYDCRTKEDLPLEQIVQSPVLFVISVFDDIITRGIWEKIGKVLPIEDHLLELAKKPRYREDRFSGKYYILENGKEKEMKKEEIIGLEGWIVWDYKSVEDRLNDHFAGRFNQSAFDSLNGRQMTGILERAKKLQNGN